ncbi:hypothetical protein BO82DRAFT_425696 [Aspergillus uvarum CBS 121591]|uniref:Uncharacterized protein n=1 Tax=Aspergillus uvarum CBS 121591 TaxID=1448315 RepID=A0A319CHI1_9EURO|nr:hypothetical protein BO82DRAFT_425696 [Aspergillus uvarum CBS 121591]PYH85115.1 hypothetical protein BO82DRAFT_425696 [Aspergillus uvarum CBS 121591]
MLAGEVARMLPAAAMLKLKQEQWLEKLRTVFSAGEGYTVKDPLGRTREAFQDLYRMVTVEMEGRGRCFVLTIIEAPEEEDKRSDGWKDLAEIERHLWDQSVRERPGTQGIYGALQMGDEVVFTQKGLPEEDGCCDAPVSTTFEAETVLSWNSDMPVIEAQLDYIKYKIRIANPRRSLRLMGGGPGSV